MNTYAVRTTTRFGETEFCLINAHSENDARKIAEDRAELPADDANIVVLNLTEMVETEFDGIAELVYCQ